MIKLKNASLDEIEGGTLVIRGSIVSESLRCLLIDSSYQREVLDGRKAEGLLDVMKAGKQFPDLDLGMRGESFTQQGELLVLNDPVYTIDGQQRVHAGKRFMEEGGTPRLGAMIHLNTTSEWERERFKALNLFRTKVAPGVLLRNERHDSVPIQTLYGLTLEEGHALHGRVTWNQKRQDGEIFSALSYFMIVARLHGHIASGRTRGISHFATTFENLVTKVGMDEMIGNVNAFFDFVDASWNLRDVRYPDGITHVRLGFLLPLASVMSDHFDFWSGNRLSMGSDLRSKLANFPTKDPQVAQLSASTGKAEQMLYTLIVEHVNSGRRTNFLHNRKAS